jgi:hypothetical protein
MTFEVPQLGCCRLVSIHEEMVNISIEYISLIPKRILASEGPWKMRSVSLMDFMVTQQAASLLCMMDTAVHDSVHRSYLLLSLGRDVSAFLQEHLHVILDAELGRNDGATVETILQR